MPRSKTQISKAHPDLREPIKVERLSLPDYMKGGFDAWSSERLVFVLGEKLRKLELLKDELKIPAATPEVRLLALCLVLAEKLYPGFRTTDDGAKRQGRPRRGDGDQLPPQTALMMVEALLKEGVAKTDQEACAMWLRACEEAPNHSQSKLSRSELEKKAKSLASVISTLRALGRKKAANQVN